MTSFHVKINVLVKLQIFFSLQGTQTERLFKNAMH